MKGPRHTEMCGEALQLMGASLLETGLVILQCSL